MNTEIEIQLIEEARNNIANRTTSIKGEPHSAPIERYRQQDVFNQEQNALFRRLPSVLLHISQLPSANNYCTVNSAFGSLVVARDGQGELRVFRNACRHRGAQLTSGSGCAKLLTCPYHAWSYSLQGELVSVPGEANCFPNLDKQSHQLVTIPSIEKYGFLWLCPQAKSDDDIERELDTHLGAITEHFDWLNAGELTQFAQRRKRWQGNWKLFAEGGLETYHFSYAHKDTIASSFHNNVAVIDQLGIHFRVVMPTRQLKSKATTPPLQSLHDCSHTLFFITPSSAFLVQKEHVDWIQFNPISAGETEITVSSLIPAITDLDDEKQRSYWQKNHDITNATLDEDWALGESIQRSIENGAIPHVNYGRNEWALRALNQVIDQLITPVP